MRQQIRDDILKHAWDQVQYWLTQHDPQSRNGDGSWPYLAIALDQLEAAARQAAQVVRHLHAEESSRNA